VKATLTNSGYSKAFLLGISSCYEIIVDIWLRVGVKFLIEKKKIISTWLFPG